MRFFACVRGSGSSSLEEDPLLDAWLSLVESPVLLLEFLTLALEVELELAIAKGSRIGDIASSDKPSFMRYGKRIFTSKIFVLELDKNLFN